MGRPSDRRLRGGGRRGRPARTACRSTSTGPASSTPSSPSGSRPAALAAPADSVTFCLSKGLACPIGSVVVGEPRLHPARPPGPQARRRRDAPGRRPRGGRASWPSPTAPTGRSRASPRTTPTPGAWPRAWPSSTGSSRPAGSPSRRPGRLDPDRAVTDFVVFRVARDRARVPRRPRGPRRPDGPLPPRHDPRRDPLRRRARPTSTPRSSRSARRSPRPPGPARRPGRAPRRPPAPGRRRGPSAPRAPDRPPTACSSSPRST